MASVSTYLGVDVLDELAHALVLDEQVVTTGDLLHDVTLDALVLEHRNSVVDENGRRCGLEIRSETKVDAPFKP